MDFAQVLVTITGIALIGMTLWFFFGKRQEHQPKGGKELYSCPMHPWITSDDPTSDCSICGMKLVRNA
jgi:hypothetical protein